MHNSYVYDDSKIDTSAFRKDAIARAMDDRSPGDTIIHFHSWDENGYLCKPDERHEYYKQGVGKVEKL
jgi:hypothetical protein